MAKDGRRNGRGDCAASAGKGQYARENRVGQSLERFHADEQPSAGFSLCVMRGLDPRIHVFLAKIEGVDGRNKSGHDDSYGSIFLHPIPLGETG